MLRSTHGTQKIVGFILEGGDTMANSLGKRYSCSVCKSEVLCTKAGTGEITCCEKPMQTQEAKAIPSSD
jgi:hypothetical protein